MHRSPIRSPLRSSRLRALLAGVAAASLVVGPIAAAPAAPIPLAVSPGAGIATVESAAGSGGVAPAGVVPVTPPVITPSTPSAASVKLTPVASGLSDPVLVTTPADGTHRLFIVQKTGTVRIVKGGSLLAGSFLSISSQVSTGSEQGLLGLAFHPSFKTNRRFYVDYTDLSGNTVIREYRASATNPNRVELGSGRTILRIAQPYPNHNGGMIAFGPDGYLYIGMGDGGSGGDPGNRAQSISTLLGKMLRIDVNGTSGTRQYRIPASNPYVGRAGLDEIWQRGLRNPWRFSFDRVTGSLWIGDVGQNRYEEVDRAVRTSTGDGRGVNWGWRVMEGFHCYIPATGCNTSGLRLPLLEYSHASNGRCAISGGYVYRGSAIPSLSGWYVYGDYCSGEVFTVPNTAASKPTPVRLFGTGSGRLISAFGQDWAGELYVCDLNGTVYRIDPA
jgi:glucose/arabinose dehydrogenase